jgi:hypothetical protein
MTTDILAAATRELRARPIDSDRVLLTLAKLRGPRPRRAHRIVALIIPIAATLVALGAWAGAAHERHRAGLEQARSEEHVVAHKKTLAPPAYTAPVDGSAEGGTSQHRSVQTPKLVVTAAPSAHGITPIVPTAPDPDALHRRAFAAYRDHEDEAALAAWDEYLKTSPMGRFVPEARWGRAAALVRLGRNAEARDALVPFARGDLGAYRQGEAKALLERL